MPAGLNLNPLDWIILLVLGLGLIRGLRLGFIRLILGLAGFVLGFWGAATWSASLVDMSERSFRMVSAAATFIRDYVEIPAEVALIPMKDLSVTDILNKVITLPLAADLKMSIARYLSSLLYNMNTVASSTVGDFLYRAFASLLLHAVAFLLILSAIRIAAVVMADVLVQTMASGPTSALTNRMMGGLIGLTQSALVMVPLVGLVGPLASLSGSEHLGGLFSGSKIAPLLSATFVWAIGLLGGGL